MVLSIMDDFFRLEAAATVNSGVFFFLIKSTCIQVKESDALL
jgi:hypothetical protein